MSSSAPIVGINVALDDERGPSWWPLVQLRDAVNSPGARRVCAVWAMALVVTFLLGAAAGALDWSGFATTVTGFEVDLTIHPPLVLALLATIWVGPAWGVAVAYAGASALAFTSGMALVSSLIFGLAGGVEVLVLWGSMVTLEIDPEVRRWRDFWRFVVVGLIAATASSLAVLLWNSSFGLELLAGQRAWRGWIVGGFLQMALLLPFLRWLGGSARGWVDRSFGVPPRREMAAPLGAVFVVGLVGILGALGVQGVYLFTGSLDFTPGGIDEALPRLREVGLFIGLMFFVVVLTAVLFTWELSRLGVRERASALRDPLTGCFNRRAFYGLFEKEADRSRRINAELSIIFFDIDHFKQVNDRHGHEVGDEVLRQLSVRVRSMLRETDLLFRWGGEEFVVILPHTTASEAPALADRIRARVAARPLVTEQAPIPVSITVSLGTAGGFDPGVSPDDLVRRADAACYKAKLAGRDRVEAETLNTMSSGKRSAGAAQLGRH